jgi:predicted nucleotidyltransferase
MQTHLEIGFELDRRWHLLRGESMDDSKKPDLLTLARTLAAAHTPYAIIGGVALQIHQDEPRTTLDIDLAVKNVHALPEAALNLAGFRATGSYPHSFNWVGPGGTPVQFSDDPAFREAIDRATVSLLDDVALRVAAPLDLLKAKLRATRDDARRRSKRVQDLADAIGLVETRPELLGQLSDEERSILAEVP